MISTTPAPERAILVQTTSNPKGRSLDRDLAGRLLEELHHLAASAGLEPVGRHLFPMTRLDSARYLSSARIDTLRQDLDTLQAGVLVINHPLSPVQQRNLERDLGVKVVDRTGIILEIFAARARTREGRLQVELASLLYQQSRLVRSWTHLERQRGGVGVRGGPGETQIELDRRQIRQRIARLKRELEEVERTRGLQRRSRVEMPLYTAVLVGYTNAGKSTLFNRLTQAEVVARDQLFATLDPTLRQVALPRGGRLILGDTVGFVRDLPHQLVAAFRATLEEVRVADLLVHVVDVSDPEMDTQMAAVDAVLRELEVTDKPMLLAYNKIDQIDPEQAEGLLTRLVERGNAVALSALDGRGIGDLLQRLESLVAAGWTRWELYLPYSEGALSARLCREGRVLHRSEVDTGVALTVELPAASAGRLQSSLETFGHKITPEGKKSPPPP
ncbi:MAG: GTPase HflX [Magnetococcus sp. WYHC-3]